MSETRHPYTVIGVYADPAYQRFSDFYEASDAEMAEAMACHEHRGLVVAGVIAGTHPAIDTDDGVVPRQAADHASRSGGCGAMTDVFTPTNFERGDRSA